MELATLDGAPVGVRSANEAVARRGKALLDRLHVLQRDGRDVCAGCGRRGATILSGTPETPRVWCSTCSSRAARRPQAPANKPEAVKPQARTAPTLAPAVWTPESVGHACVFDRSFRGTRDGSAFECAGVRPGAFLRAIKSGRSIKCLVNHDWRWVIGETGDGSLRLREDNCGLRVEFAPRSTAGRDFVRLVREGSYVLGGMSIGGGITDLRYGTGRDSVVFGWDLDEVTVVVGDRQAGNYHTWIRLADAEAMLHAAQLDREGLERKRAAL